MPQNHYDVIVIGVGSMGAATCWHLAGRGQRVLGIEQFNIVHDQGSHVGQSRIIRKAYFEHPDYGPLLERAYENWRNFETETSARLFECTGIVYMGKPDNANIEGILRSSSLHHVPVKELTAHQAQTNFSAFVIPADFKILFEPDAGFVTPEKTIRLYAAAATAKGAVVRTNEKVDRWKATNDGVRVVTDKGEYTSKKLVITAGAWTARIVPPLSGTLKVTKQLLAWVRPKDPALFSMDNFPCWFIEDPDLGTYYGFPVLPENEYDGPAGLKLARHYPGDAADPDRRNDNVPANFEEEIHSILRKYIPAADGDIIAVKSCLYTYSPDEHFIIDLLPGYSDRVVIACGFSGHGFKFVPVVGEILADLALLGKTDLPAGFLSLSRIRNVG